MSQVAIVGLPVISNHSSLIYSVHTIAHPLSGRHCSGSEVANKECALMTNTYHPCHRSGLGRWGSTWEGEHVPASIPVSAPHLESRVMPLTQRRELRFREVTSSPKSHSL